MLHVALIKIHCIYSFNNIYTRMHLWLYVIIKFINCSMFCFMIQINDVWLDNTCSTRFNCTSNDILLLTTVSCSEFASCSIADGSPVCTCNTGYRGDGYSCRSEYFIYDRNHAILCITHSPTIFMKIARLQPASHFGIYLVNSRISCQHTANFICQSSRL